ncbi:hypothetical protein BD410DRAFT_314283 [Rickenella mellea]|uniref:DUF6535 domain-containing protein n=1 Tax=Rickenella mellea TaxID=50990 RepID=A0A4Y7Q2M7_9AGAM|nr:hypothetical protein BD410DRAFT_314283 [Rickenella mellea]
MDEKSYTSKDRNNVYGDPSDKVWSFYVEEGEKFDKTLVEIWRGDMDGILIFSGLFSASVTAFIIESYKALKQDSGDTTVAILSQISSQLVAISNGTDLNLPSHLPTPVSFHPTLSAVCVNMLWFFSLTLSLTCALGATMVEQWARPQATLMDAHVSV